MSNSKVVVVSGAGSGLGQATALTFGRAGYRVACLDVSEAGLARTHKQLAGEEVLSAGFVCDVNDSEAVSGAVQQLHDHFGQIDVLVNNAAVDVTLGVHEMTIAQWDRVIGVNLRGPFLLSRAVLPHMQAQRSGHIVNVASTAATRAWANASAYLASKWGLVGFSRGLGVEGRPYNIRVSTIIPGGMRTHFFDRFHEQGIPMPDEANLQDPANVADVILYTVQMPVQSVVQEVIVTPLTETSWP